MSNFKNKLVWKIKTLLESYMVWRSDSSLSWWRTLFLNFYFLPFHQAKKFPIYVYGKMKLTKLKGQIKIDCPLSEISKGMIKLNPIVEASGAIGGDMIIILGDGKLIFEGPTRIATNSKILIWGGGTLRIGSNTYMNSGFNIACCNSIIIGDYTRCGPDVQIFDTDFHFTFTTPEYIIRKNNSPVKLGHHCWIGARSSVMKGITLPPHTTLASNSLANKNIVTQERCLIAGTPAKLVKEGFSRVFNYNEECKLFQYFKTHPEEHSLKLEGNPEQYD